MGQKIFDVSYFHLSRFKLFLKYILQIFIWFTHEVLINFLKFIVILNISETWLQISIEFNNVSNFSTTNILDTKGLTIFKKNSNNRDV